MQPPLGAVTVVGSINVDLVAQTVRLPAAGETVLGSDLVRSPGGKGANQAAAAARLGAQTRMIGAVGSDPDGAWMRETLASAGVDVSSVRTVQAPTGTALIVVDQVGENQIVVCPGANAHVTISDLGRAPTVLAQLEVPHEQVWGLVDHPGFLAINAAPAASLPERVIARADLVIVNETEYALLPELTNAALVAVTAGSRGASLLARGTVIAQAEAPRVAAIDAVGAGDAFSAAITLALSSGWDRAAALRAACAVGAHAVTVRGAQPPLRPLETYLQDAETSVTDTP